MTIQVTPTGQPCGAHVTGVNLGKPLSDLQIAEIRAAWLEHHVLAFPDQKLDHDQMEMFAQQFGELGEDPYFNPLPGRKYIAAVRREAEDTNPIFAEYWHSDWSFMEHPPSGTILYSLDIPPHGGDTHFSNQHLAFEKMPDDMRERFADLKAVHSPALGYSLDGVYGDVEKNGAMDIRPSAEAAHIRFTHPLAPKHPETGRRGFLSGISYICGFEGIDDQRAFELVLELNEWQPREEFVYRHRWENDMFVMWDNRSVVHKAIGGYEGFRRELHRITVY